MSISTLLPKSLGCRIKLSQSIACVCDLAMRVRVLRITFTTLSYNSYNTWKQVILARFPCEAWRCFRVLDQLLRSKEKSERSFLIFLTAKFTGHGPSGAGQYLQFNICRDHAIDTLPPMI